MREQDGCQGRFPVENVRRHVWQPCFVIVMNVVHVRGSTTQCTLNNMVVSLDRRLNSVPQQLRPRQKIALGRVVGHPVREGVSKKEKLVVPARLYLLVDATFSQVHDFLFFCRITGKGINRARPFPSRAKAHSVAVWLSPRTHGSPKRAELHARIFRPGDVAQAECTGS